MRIIRPVFAAGILVLLAGPVLAQGERYATISVRAGYTKPPKGDANDLAIGQSLKGQSSFGASAMVALGDRLHLGLTADWAHHSVYQVNPDPPPDRIIIGGATDPQWNIVHAFLKVSYDLVQVKSWTVALNAGPGLMVFSPNQIIRDAQGLRTDAHFAVNGGATITWWFADRIGIIASPQLDYAMKKTKGQIFTDKGAIFFPITGGFQFKI
jgi:hypothetical protein